MDTNSYPFNPADWSTITPLFNALNEAPLSPGNFLDWLEQWNQLDIAIWDAYTHLKRRAYNDTSNQAAEKQYQVYVQELYSTYLGLNQMLIKRALTIQPDAPTPDHQQLWRRWQNQMTLFHPDSLPIQADISQLESRYREYMNRYEGTPEKPFAYWMERREELNELMMRLLKLRRALARTSGLPNFLAYRWRELNRLGYSIEDCRAFHDAVEKTVVPAIVRLGLLEKLHQPSPTIADMDVVSTGVERILRRVDPAFGDVFHTMRDSGHLDIGSRPHKVHTLEEWFFPADGMPHVHLITADVDSLLHESGHAMHDYLSFQTHKSMWNLNGPEEFQEFVAISMEMLSWPYYDEARGGLFSAAESAAAHKNVLRYYLESLSSDVMHDAFEHWVYGDAPEDVTPADLDAKWLELKRRFVPWDNQYANEDEFMTGWQRWTWSLFRIPLYMISYPMAIVGTCQFGRMAETDRTRAVQNYKAVLALGNTRTMSELFRAVGLDFPFTAEAVDTAFRFIVEQSQTI